MNNKKGYKMAVNKVIWKPIKGYEDLYEVSNYGQVKSLAKSIIKNNDTIQERKERILKPIVKDDSGYLRIVLYKDEGLKRFYLHRLVADHHVDNPDNKPEVGHRDKDRTNCKASNLKWETRSENIKHMWNYKPTRKRKST